MDLNAPSATTGHIISIKLCRDNQAAALDIDILDGWLFQFQSLHDITLNLPQLKDSNTKEISSFFRRFSSLKNKNIIIDNKESKSFNKTDKIEYNVPKSSANKFEVIDNQINWSGMDFIL